MHLLRVVCCLFFISYGTISLAANGSSNGSSNGAANGQPFQDLQDQIDALQAQVDGMGSGHQGPYTVQVYCDAAESVNAALAAAPSSALNVRVEIFGTCNENIVANRANVSFWGMTTGAGVAVASGTAIRNNSHDRMGIIDLTLTSNGGTAVQCGAGSLGIFNSTINASTGVWMDTGCDGQIWDTTIDGGFLGIGVTSGSNMNLFGVEVNNATGFGMFVLNGSLVQLGAGATGPTVFSSNNNGVTVDGNSVLLVRNAEVSDSVHTGVHIDLGSYIRVTDESRFVSKNNGAFGLGIFNNSTAAFWNNPTVEITGNGGEAIACDDSIKVGGNLTGEPNVTIPGSISPSCPSNL